MRRSSSVQSRRGGKILVLSALLLVPLCGLLALSVDVGVIAVAKAQLQTAADAAALAGAMQLTGSERLKQNPSMSGLVSLAHSQPTVIAKANSVLNASVQISSNTSNTTSGDVVVGYLDTSKVNSSLLTGSSSISLFNSVQVTTSRSASRGTAVSSLFARIWNIHSTDVTASATATAQNFAIVGFKSQSGTSSSVQGAPLIPLALSLPTYNAMLSGLTTDTYDVQPNGLPIIRSTDGIYESSLYPVGSTSGNWGSVKIGVTNNSTQTLGNQIQNGVSASDLSGYPGGELQIGSLSSPLMLGANPGISLGIKPALDSLIGKTVVIPIYDPAGTTGVGNTTSYEIVRFAVVTVVDSYFYGLNRGVIVQPAVTRKTSSMVLGAPQPSWQAGGVTRVWLTR